MSDRPETKSLANGEFVIAGQLYRFNMSVASIRGSSFGKLFETSTAEEIITQIAPLIEPGRAFAEQTFGLIETCRHGRWAPTTDGELALALEALQPGELCIIKEAFVSGLSAFFMGMPQWSTVDDAAVVGVQVSTAIQSMAENVLGLVLRTQAAAAARIRAEIEPEISRLEKTILESPLAMPADTTPESSAPSTTGT